MCSPVIIHINSSFTVLKSTQKSDYEPECMKMSLNHTLEVLQMQNSDHLLSCADRDKTLGGGPNGKRQGLFYSYCLHL